MALFCCFFMGYLRYDGFAILQSRIWNGVLRWVLSMGNFHFIFFLLLVFFAIAFLGFLSYIARDFDFSLELESQSRSIRLFSDDV